MPTFIVEWSSPSKLPCATCVPVDVILCTLRNGLPIVNAQVIGSRRDITPRSLVNCKGDYVYKLSYINDDVGFVPLTCRDITSVLCKGCLTTWVESLIPAPGEIYNDITYQALHDFLADPNTPVNLDLLVSNASLTKPMQATAQWGYVQNFNSTNFGDLTGVSLQLFIDGTPISTFVNQSAGITVPPVNITTSGGTGVHPFVIAPGAANLLSLVFTPFHGALLPDLAWRTKDMYLSAYGVAL